MNLPNTYTEENDTGCCGVPNIKDWNNNEITFQNRHFIRVYTRSFLYMPLNMGKAMKLLNKTAERTETDLPPEQAIVLCRDLSPWKAELLYGVTEPIVGADNVEINGKFITKVFEGPYKDAKEWHERLYNYAVIQGHEVSDIYFFYTTCPKCAKYYGKNYTIGLARIE